MHPTYDFILEFLESHPIGKTDHFGWFISDIGVIALFHKGEDFEIYNLSGDKEAN